MPDWVEVECVTGKWIVSLDGDELHVTSPSGERLHRSRGHMMAGQHIAMLLSHLETSRVERNDFVEQLALRDKEIELLKAAYHDAVDTSRDPRDEFLRLAKLMGDG